jgi:polysaccharide biosynthesis transport protein
MAQLGKTCLIDGDMRRPTISEAFGAPAKVSWSDFLSGAVSLDKALVEVKDVKNLSFLSVGPSQSDPGGLINSAGMKALLGLLRNYFEFLVIDSPPAIPFSDARLLSLLADGVVLVGRYGLTTQRALERCTEHLRGVGAPIIGVAINGIDFSSADYRYYNFGHSSAKLQGYYPDKTAGAVLSQDSGSNTKAKGAGA